jgi:type I restriction enzyme S subunit
LKTPYLNDSSKRITEKGLGACSAHLLRVGCVVMSSRAPIGYVALPTVPFCTNQGCKTIKLKDGFHSEFAYYNILFNIDKVKNLGEGTTFAEISKAALATVALPFPTSLPEQTKIAEILSTMDRAIEQTEALIAQQQRIKTGLMQDLLTRGIDEHGNLRSETTHTFKESPLGRIPVEWDVKTLEQLTSRIVDGVHHTPTYVESGVPFIVITDLTAGAGIDFSSTRFVSPKDHRDFSRRADPSPGDVLVTKDGTLGVARIVPPEAPEFSIFVSVAMLRPKQTLCFPELIWAFFESGDFLTQLGALSAGTGLAHIHLEHFRSFLVRRPHMDEQRLIFCILNKQENLLNSTIAGLAKLKIQKTALMQDLLTGKKRVTSLLEPEPAN